MGCGPSSSCHGVSVHQCTDDDRHSSLGRTRQNGSFGSRVQVRRRSFGTLTPQQRLFHSRQLAVLQAALERELNTLHGQGRGDRNSIGSGDSEAEAHARISELLARIAFEEEFAELETNADPIFIVPEATPISPVATKKLSDGLNAAQIESVTARKTYCSATHPTPDAEGTYCTECVLCLAEYTDGEELRELPCSHFYHLGCIDEWLQRHPTCPLCSAVARKLSSPKSTSRDVVDSVITSTAVDSVLNHPASNRRPFSAPVPSLPFNIAESSAVTNAIAGPSSASSSSSASASLPIGTVENRSDELQRFTLEGVCAAYANPPVPSTSAAQPETDAPTDSDACPPTNTATTISEMDAEAVMPLPQSSDSTLLLNHEEMSRPDDRPPDAKPTPVDIPSTCNEGTSENVASAPPETMPSPVIRQPTPPSTSTASSSHPPPPAGVDRPVRESSTTSSPSHRRPRMAMASSMSFQSEASLYLPDDSDANGALYNPSGGHHIWDTSSSSNAHFTVPLARPTHSHQPSPRTHNGTQPPSPVLTAFTLTSASSSIAPTPIPPGEPFQLGSVVPASSSSSTMSGAYASVSRRASLPSAALLINCEEGTPSSSTGLAVEPPPVAPTHSPTLTPITVSNHSSRQPSSSSPTCLLSPSSPDKNSFSPKTGQSVGHVVEASRPTPNDPSSQHQERLPPFQALMADSPDHDNEDEQEILDVSLPRLSGSRRGSACNPHGLGSEDVSPCRRKSHDGFSPMPRLSGGSSVVSSLHPEPSASPLIGAGPSHSSRRRNSQSGESLGGEKDDQRFPSIHLGSSSGSHCLRTGSPCAPAMTFKAHS